MAFVIEDLSLNTHIGSSSHYRLRKRGWVTTTSGSEDILPAVWTTFRSLASRETARLWAVLDLTLRFEDILKHDGIVRINPFCAKRKFKSTSLIGSCFSSMASAIRLLLL